MFELSRTCSTFNKGNWDIHLIGWDNGVPASRIVSFRDYYYFRADKVDVISRFSKQEFSNEPPMTTIDDFKAVKVTYTSLVEKKKLVELNEEYTYEADVLPEFKYLMSKGLKWSSFRHILYFDIETTVNEDNDKANDPEKALCEVTAISCYSTLFDKYFTFTWHPEITADCSTPKIEEDGNKIKIFCRTEESVLCAFFEFVKEYNVDIISGWWSSGFDLPYIINRSIRLGLDDYRKLSPIGNVACYKRGEDWKIYIDGIDHIDLLEAIKDLGYNLSNYKLATVAKEVLKNPDLEKLTHVTWRDWKDNYNGFMEYSVKDVEVLMEISRTLQVFPLYINIQQISNLTKLSLVLSKSFIVDHYILTEYFGKIVCPTRITKEKQKYMGAIVLDPVPGLHESVAVMDFASLYPTTIMAFNLSPETFICSEESCLKMGKTIEEVIEKLNEKNIPFVDTKHDSDLFGGRYLFYAHSYKVGLLPQILRKMFISRKDIKKQMRNSILTEDEVTALDKKQMAYKLIMNSTYGAMGFNYFRLYTPEVADSITFFARKALLFGVKCFNHFNTDSVLYCDTDSIFSLKRGLSHDEMEKLLNDFNNSLRAQFIDHYNSGMLDEFRLMELEYEKDLERIYFSDAKKRYYAIHEGTGKKYIRGMNIIRKDTPEFLKKALNEVAEKAVRKILTVGDLVELFNHIKEQPLKMIGISKSFTKPFSKYDKMYPQHVNGAEWANTILGTKNTYKNVLLMFYIKSLCEEELKPRLRRIAICLKEEDLGLVETSKHLFEIDYRLFFKKQVIEQLEEFDKIPEILQIIQEFNKLDL